MSANGRLGGRGIPGVENGRPKELLTYTLPSMEAAIEAVQKTPGMLARFNKPDRRERILGLCKPMLLGDNRINQVLEMADRLIDEALVIDPRLVKKTSWVRCEEGIDACPALIASGEERAFFDRRRARIGDTATLEPVRIVISTDTKHIQLENAAAFVAAAKLAQQFRPLEVWWQGSWLNENDTQCYCEKGHVFHVPLVTGDMDFRRIQFVLCDTTRDSTSFYVMFAHAYPKWGWQGGVAQRSLLDNTFDFVSEKGMSHDADDVARKAAKWAGFEALWRATISGNEAVQNWEHSEEALKRQEYWRARGNTPASREDRLRWEQEDRERKRREAADAKARLDGAVA